MIRFTCGYLHVDRGSVSDERDVSTEAMPAQDEPKEKDTLTGRSDDSGLVHDALIPEVEESPKDVNQENQNLMENQVATTVHKAALAAQFERNTLSIALDDIYGVLENNAATG